MLDSKQRDGIDDEQLSLDAQSIGADSYIESKRNKPKGEA